jgi:hypothetical protein
VKKFIASIRRGLCIMPLLCSMHNKYGSSANKKSRLRFSQSAFYSKNYNKCL